jgi:NADH dehydrogenase
MKVFLTGGTGFVGNAVAAGLLEAGHIVRALVRKGSEKKLRVADRCEILSGELENVEALDAGLNGIDAVIHLVGIIKEDPKRGVTFVKAHVGGTTNVAQAAMRKGVRRFIQMSALGARAGAPTQYFRTKWEAEEYLRSLDLDLTVFRPSVIIGPGGEFSAMLKQLCSLPITPVIGDGNYRLQPVALKNVVECFVRSVVNTKTIGKAYCVGGPEQVSFNDMLRTFGEALGKKVRLIHLPKRPIKIMTHFFENLPGWPITSEQLAMLEEDHSCDLKPLVEDFQIELLPLRRAYESDL